MAGFVRMKTKPVTYALDDRVKARLVGGFSGRDGSDISNYYVSSGSEHSADYDSPCLSELVHEFLVDEEESSGTRFPDNEPDSERVDPVTDEDAIDSVLGLSPAVSGNGRDMYLKLLRTNVSDAVEAFSRLRSGGNKSALRRSVMSFLRGLGHNAGICKTSWSSSGNVTAGSYEFIDVVSVQSNFSTWQSRHIVDLDFAAEFEIARPTSGYSRLLQCLPRDFVGSSEDLKRIVRVVSDAVKRSLRSKELSVPPWRKNRYMQNKWFGPYKRTTNTLTEKPFSQLSSAVFAPVSGAKCRWVGFDDAVSDSNVNGRLYVRT